MSLVKQQYGEKWVVNNRKGGSTRVYLFLHQLERRTLVCELYLTKLEEILKY